MLTQTDKEIRLKQVFSQLDRKFEEEQVQRKAASLQTPYINLYGFPVDSAALNMLSKQTAQAAGLIIFYKEGRNLKIGAMEITDEVKKAAKDLTDKSYFVELYLISKSSFEHAFTNYKTILNTERKSQEVSIVETAADEKMKIESLSDLGSQLAKALPTEMINLILSAALALESSDVHIEPESDDVKIRYRIDGVLQDITKIPNESHHQMVSRIKILSKLKLNVTATPQDGSFSLKYNSKPVDVRVSVLPSAFGESLVLRILRQDKGALKFEDLGIVGSALEKLKREMEKPNGMILTTGPTGSGKTTTLYAILNKLNEPGVKIITLEDPVEYKIEGLTQTPIDSKAGLTFAAGLRAVLRQDPDVVMVGEMRDLETAEIACQAALTGHIVLSTLHTNDAAGAIPRLIDLGVKSFTLAPAINAIIAQRLVRKICTECKKEYVLPKHTMARVEMILKAIPQSSKTEIPNKLTFYHSEGCSACKGLGYKGRMGIYEIFTISGEIEKMILKGTTYSEIKNQATVDGMLTMAQDGILKALSGVTDVEEVFRVTEE